MRLAILISLAALGWSAPAVGSTPAASAPAVDHDALVPCQIGERGGFLVPVSYADEHRSDILATLPDEPDVDDFWKVTEQIAIVADRMLREKLEGAAKDPTLLFPDLPPGSDASLPNSIGYQKLELKLILEHYPVYHRQYVGLMMGGHKVVLVNYAIGLATDPAAGYVFIHRYFIPHRSHFLQCRFDWDEKVISNVSTYGSWQDSP